jgi:hypothetical protein
MKTTTTEATETKCYCAACETGAGVCRKLWTEQDWLDRYGFSPFSDKVRPVGKGPEIHGKREPVSVETYRTVRKLFG